MIRLQLFGYPTLTCDGSAVSGAATQRHRLALLASLALAPSRTLPRDKLLGLLWPDADPANARHSLNTSVHVIRAACGEAILHSRANEITLSATVGVDVSEFELAVEDGDDETAAALYKAPLLDAFYIDGAQEFEDWISRQRTRYSTLVQGARERLAERHEQAGEWRDALRWWHVLSHDDPFNSRIVMRHMTALECVGDSGNALDLAREHEALLGKELEAEPPPEFRELVRRMKTAPNGHAMLAAAPPGSRTELANAPAVTMARRGHAWWKKPVSAIGLVLLGAAGWALVAAEPVVDRQQRLLVLPFENLTGDSTLQSLSRIAASWITDGLTRSGAVDVVQWTDPQQKNQLSSDGEREARDARASFVMRGVLHPSGPDSLRIEATVIDIAGRKVIATLPQLSGSRKDPMPALELLRSRLAGLLAAYFDGYLGPAVATIAPPKYAAYLEFVAGLDRVQTPRHESIPRFLAAARIDSSFTLAIIWAAYALDRCQTGAARTGRVTCPDVSWDSLMAIADQRRATFGRLEHAAFNFATAWRTRDHRLYYEAATEAAKLVPVSFWTAHAFIAAGDRGRRSEELAIMESVRDVPLFDRVFPAFGVWYEIALHEAGRFEEALRALRVQEAKEDLLNPPTSVLVRKAGNFAALGLVDSALHVSDLLTTFDRGVNSIVSVAQELHKHGHRQAGDSLSRACGNILQSLAPDTAVARMLLVARCAEVRRDFRLAHQMIDRCCSTPGPNRTGMTLTNAGVYAALSGDTSAAMAYVRAIDSLPLAKSQDTRGFPEQFEAEKLHAKATITAALGDAPQAVRLLQDSFSRWGRYRLQFHHFQLANPAFDPIRSYPPYRRLVEALP